MPSPRPTAGVLLLNTMLRICYLMVLELMWNSVGSWRFCFSQRMYGKLFAKGILNKGQLLFMTSSLGCSLCAGVLGGDVSSPSDKCTNLGVLSEFCAAGRGCCAWGVWCSQERGEAAGAVLPPQPCPCPCPCPGLCLGSPAEPSLPLGQNVPVLVASQSCSGSV